jgi:GH15 family glucan-1,4-alpha-glucosidase
VALRIEDYGLIGDGRTAALVGRDGGIDWLCLPRFDAPACFSALLGGRGAWTLGPPGGVPLNRRYRPDSLVLETDLACGAGSIRITDGMTQGSLVRLITGLEGRVEVRSNLDLAFDYGARLPLWRKQEGVLRGVAGPHAVVVDGDVPHTPSEDGLMAEITVSEGETLAARMSWATDRSEDPRADVEACDAHWRRWASAYNLDGPYRDLVVRSLLTLKALTYEPSGGIVAAATTSLPEQLGGPRNWDYRYCWLRDATFTLLALLEAGYRDEAAAWREWLLRALAGTPQHLQIMYGIDGERRLPEAVLDLPGYGGSQPVRVGNAASEQFQMDVYGELMDALHVAREHLVAEEDAWHAQVALLEVLESRWQDPDRGIWEMRGPARHFVHSKVMAWVAVDRAIAAVERARLDGPADHWKQLRHAIAEEVCDRGYDGRKRSFVQSYASTALDAATLLIPAVGFLRARDPRVLGTIAAVERELLHDGLVLRYDADDGLPGGEGAFLPCTFWLADAHALAGRNNRARQIFEHVTSLGNDLGLFTEEYDAARGRAVGNVPQALTHVSVVNTAHLLTAGGGARRRAAARSRSRT